MQTIRNGAVAVTADETGRGLRLMDLKRGTVWLLNESSAKWGGRITKDENATDDGIAALQALVPVAASAEGNTLAVTYSAGGCPVLYRYSLLEDGVEVRLAPPKSDEIEALSLPGAFLPQHGGMKLLLPVMQGMLWDGRGERLSHVRRSGSHLGFSMQMAGVL
jgi:hypothetical protein